MKGSCIVAAVIVPCLIISPMSDHFSHVHALIHLTCPYSPEGQATSCSWSHNIHCIPSRFSVLHHKYVSANVMQLTHLFQHGKLLLALTCPNPRLSDPGIVRYVVSS